MTYRVVITELLQKMVAVEAADVPAAEAVVEDALKRGEYILDADCFQSVDFTAVNGLKADGIQEAEPAF